MIKNPNAFVVSVTNIQHSKYALSRTDFVFLAKLLERI